MRFINASYADFIRNTKSRKIVLFGASSLWNYYMNTFPDIVEQVVNRTLFVVDNNPIKQGKIFEINGKKIEIKSIDALSKQQDYVILIVISMAYQEEVCRQLMGLNLPFDIECYSLPLMIYSQNQANNSCVEDYFAEHVVGRIPQKIHSFWFSGDEKPDIYKRCIESWHKYCPDYEIIEWNSNDYDITKNRYMKQAYECKKWAFVSDYARLDVIHEYGGIYLDMDVELTASIDRLRNATAFFCRQGDGFVELGSGFGAARGNDFIKEMLNEYTEKDFIDNTGKMDMTPQPERLSKIFLKHNIQICHDSQVIDDMVFLSNEYIVSDIQPDLMGRLENKIGIHWHNAGWHSEKDKYILKKSMEARQVLLQRYFKLPQV